ncbi:MAG: NfeD family protein [Opitutales bacterium]
MSFLQRYWLSWLLWSALTVTAVAQSPLVDTSEIDARPAANEKVAVYVIPIEGMIGKPNLYILRRGLKEAIRNDIEMVILDMDTPGGRVDVCLEMMEALDRFDGITATYVNEDAISAGSFIAASTESIYFAPRGKIGASAVIQGTGEDVPETARLKMESYLRANIRVMAAEERYRADVIRAMLDADFELKVGETVIKPAGELLTLTAPEAMQEYGEPPEPLLGAGIYPDLEALLVAKFGAGHYEIKDFQITYSEEWAKWLNTFAPALMGIGMLLLFLEFKTPGFGIFGIGGITLIAIFFISQYIAGLAGNEPILFFILGVLLILAEILFFAGTIVFAASGLLLMAGSLLWAMVDFWPGGKTELSAELFLGPMVNLIFGLALAMGGALLLSRVLKGSWMERQLVLDEVAGGPAATGSAAKPALLGHLGRVVTPLHPAGRVEIDGVRYEASCAVGSIDLGATVRVVGASDFGWIVEEVTDPC